MRILTNIGLALCLGVGVAGVGCAGTASAQGFYFDAPGVHIHAGKRHHHHYRYYRGYRPGYEAYGADLGHPYGYNYNYGDPRCGIPNYTIQGGECKPYRGY
jgi:hypothetical protein